MRNKPIFRLMVGLVLATCVSIGGCASTINKTMDSWIGHHQSELIQSWGPPTQTAADGKGGSILIYGSYVDLGQAPGTASVDPYGNVRYTAPKQRGYSLAIPANVNSRSGQFERPSERSDALG